MADKYRQFVDDPIVCRAIAALERQGFKVRGRSAEETIGNLKQVLNGNLPLASVVAPSGRQRRHAIAKVAPPQVIEQSTRKWNR